MRLVISDAHEGLRQAIAKVLHEACWQRCRVHFIWDLLAHGGRGGRPLQPKTVRHVHTTLRKALADAVEARHLTWNPAATAKAPRVRRTKDPAAWDSEQLGTFLQYIASDRLAALWILAASTGMRRGELLGLRWRDLDLDGGELSIRQTVVCYGKLLVIKEPKTERGRRTIPLDPRAVAALRVHHRSQAEERLAAGGAYADQGLTFSDEIGNPSVRTPLPLGSGAT